MASILKVVRDFFAPQFQGPSWSAWSAALAACFGLPATDDQRALILQCTGRARVPTTPAREFWMIIGRRGGKSIIAALIAVYLAVFRTYRFAPGERGVVVLLAADRRQARVIYRYVLGLFEASSFLKVLDVRIDGEPTQNELRLTNGISIEIHTSSFRAVRGYTIVACVCDEIAFWPTEESSNPDAETLNAVRPAMATIPDALLVVLSSPYARRGELWRTYRQHFGQDGDVLVWQADTRTMNPTVPQSVIDRAYADDPARASAEYGALFRQDVETFVSQEVIDAATIPGRQQLPPLPGVTAIAFVDPAGGSGADSFTACVAHRERGRVVVDVVLERRPPFSPEATVEEFAATLKTYGVSSVTGDRYAGEWPREAFRKNGLVYNVSELTASDLYRELLPLLNSGQVELLDSPRLTSQIVGLERRPARSGKDLITHPPNGHDDVAVVVAGACVLAAAGASHLTEEQVAQMWAIGNPHDDLAMGTLTDPDGGQMYHTKSFNRRL